MTGEDETADGTLRTRQNVVHEAGLFQGKLGFNRAIVLLEKDVETFSNIEGIQQLRYDQGHINSTFEIYSRPCGASSGMMTAKRRSDDNVRFSGKIISTGNSVLGKQ